MKRTVFLILFTFSTFSLLATHNRAGEITYRQLSALTYEVTITTYTYTLSAADRDELEMDWGDNSTSIVPRESKTELPNYYRKNVYIGTHTYPGPGIYKLLVQDPNRNLGVENIPNSVNVIFSITSILTVSTSIENNHAPELLNSPFDKAAVGYVFVHNPGAYDVDGDSLSYELTTCTSINGEPIENYSLPPASNAFSLDPVSGDLVWDSPMTTGKYNVAIEIQEWRNGKKIGVVIRDMQIDVFETDNDPPELDIPEDFCMEVGDFVDITITAIDENDDDLTLSATSGLFTLDDCPATFPGDRGVGPVSSVFNWMPCHESVRNQPYNVLVKVDDNNSDVNLVDIEEFSIKVLGPSPLLVDVIPVGKSIRLNWQEYGTDVIAGFHIYRREGASGYEADSCTAGLPPYTGFDMIGYVPGSSSTEFLDIGGEDELRFGLEYTYRIVAVYPNGAESKPSDELTTSLISGLPVMRNVSVRESDEFNGSVLVSWKKPDNLDTIPEALGPFEYIVYRAEGIDGVDFVFLENIPTADLNDTVFIDTLINTKNSGFNYKVELWNMTSGNNFMVGDPGYSSSLFLEASPGDRKSRLYLSKNVPWLNSRYDIFRYNNVAGSWDSIGSTEILEYVDEGLENGIDYQYLVKSVGGYQFAGMPKDLINYSEVITVTPIDNEPPCRPTINVSSNCVDLYNTVVWSVVGGDGCDAEVEGYFIYYKGINDEELTLLTTIDDNNILTFDHQLTEDALSGCYAVSAFDQAGNESLKSTMVCVDSCNFYEIPNIFTPNGDGMNDYLVARASGLVEKVDFQLFGRSGVLMFRTDDPELNWDGKYKGSTVPPGVYFYQCEVFELRMTGLEQFHLSGFIHVMTESGTSNQEIIY